MQSGSIFSRYDPLPFRKHAASIDIFILSALVNHGRLSTWTDVKWKEEINAGFLMLKRGSNLYP
jgi:hypothetical protein